MDAMMQIYLLCLCATSILVQSTTAYYTKQWVLHVDGGQEVADRVAVDHGFHNLGEIFEDYYHFASKGPVKRSLDQHHTKRIALAVDTRIRWAKQQVAKSRRKRDYVLIDTDPKWPSMWYLNRGNGLDMNVIPAWLEGITGKGAVVTILDDGLEKDHPDLFHNYDPMASYDVNNQDSDPSPRYDMIDSNRHGTRCAGEVAATSNNSVCALGVAHGAQVGGVRMLDGDVTDAVEARSLSLNPHHIDIYSASWGPDDDGKTVDGPGELATRAFMEGVSKGRKGKGSIFVWASGNGGRDHDNCNCDGYTNSIYSLSISSATEKGNVPWYSEACSSTLASTYSSGAVGEKQVVTTDLHHSCTSSHTGTSASAPLAAGICALALEANPNLTWRDMQHIVVRTARPQRLRAEDWQTNGVGRNVSHSFGYGLMDAHAMVQLARKWITVPEQHKCEIPAPQVERTIPPKSTVVLQLQVSECHGVNVLEHVQAKLSIFSHKRGDLQIQLTSPMGTRVTLLAHRIHDVSRSGFTHWPFMSVHSWGESPFGTWQLEIRNDGLLGRATLQNWSLVLYGTKTLSQNDVETQKSSSKSKSSSKKKKQKQKSKGQKATSASPFPPSTSKKGKSQSGGGRWNSKLNTAAPKTNQIGAKSQTKPFVSSFYYAVNSKLNEFAKNITITYPVMIPAREFEKTRVDYRKIQKQKEISRDINSNRKNFTPRPNSSDQLLNITKGRKTTAAAISAWDLVLYGTASPPAADSKGVQTLAAKQPPPVKGGNKNDDDFEHNSIDTDVPPGWKSNAKIHKETSQVEDLAPEINTLNGCQKSRGYLCIVCMENLFLFDGMCAPQCPENFFPVVYVGGNEKAEDSSPALNYCNPCHYSCKSCNGSNDYDCNDCYPDAVLFTRTKDESYCYPNSMMYSLNEIDWYYGILIFVLVLVALGLAIALFVYCIRSKPNRGDFMKMNTYKNIRNIERKVKSAVYSDSE
ncbi:PREDICTED: furin-like protease 1 isoform X2 [Nicrophorus vespilloides]|uniref:Furin-like protease 1 isoform X2 n=1 Tax=Nicrophorus vespilloides TaxID=110193 RepID=A0ABM1MGJ3_NICVS|nr:PREDICTED: furin-like protease 1 isoform X2 [Nicrophorus vespilloides]